MLERLAALHVRELAEKAHAARAARDRFLSSIPDEALDEPKPARGAHDPLAVLGVNVLPESDPDRSALEGALAVLPSTVLRELWALVLIGRGDYGIKDWDKAMAEANALSDIDERLFLEQVDLHEYLTKVVYELERM